MLLVSNVEYRGKIEKKKSDGSLMRSINLEDENGEGCKFPLSDDCDVSTLKKGDKIIATLEYSIKYGSFKCVKTEVRK